jgi:hypothetical protein
MFKYSHRKPDPLKLLAIVVTVAVLMTSAVDAAEPFHGPLNLADLADGELMIAPVGRQGAGIHMSYPGNPGRYDEGGSTHLDQKQASSSPAVFLSVRVPW